MWKLKGLVVSKSDDDFNSSLDSEISNDNSENKFIEDEILFKKEKRAKPFKENFTDEKISIFPIADKDNKKVDWSLLYTKLFKNLGDVKNVKKICLKEIELRLDSTLNKYDAKKGVIKKNKNFDLSRVKNKNTKDNFISNIFETYSNKEKNILEKKSSGQVSNNNLNLKDSKKLFESTKFFSDFKLKQENSQLRTSYIKMIKNFDINAINLNKNNEEKFLERNTIRSKNEKPGTIKFNQGNNFLKRLLSSKESTESIQHTSPNFYDKEEIFKNFQHDIRSYEKEAVKLKQASLEIPKFKEIVEFTTFDELRDKINMAKIENKFYSKILLNEYKNKIDLIIAKMNTYTKMKEKYQIL